MAKKPYFFTDTIATPWHQFLNEMVPKFKDGCHPPALRFHWISVHTFYIAVELHSLDFTHSDQIQAFFQKFLKNNLIKFNGLYTYT